MLRRMLITALAAGLAAGVVVTLMQQLRVTPLILQAERFEQPQRNSSPSPGENVQNDADEGVGRLWAAAASNILTGVGFALLLAAAYALHGWCPQLVLLSESSFGIPLNVKARGRGGVPAVSHAHAIRRVENRSSLQVGPSMPPTDGISEMSASG